MLLIELAFLLCKEESPNCVVKAFLYALSPQSSAQKR